MRGRPWPFDFQRQKQTKAFPMPANQRVGLNDRQGFAPRQQLRNFVGAITRRGWRWRSTRKRQLLAGEEVLGGQGTTRPQARADESYDIKPQIEQRFE